MMIDDACGKRSSVIISCYNHLIIWPSLDLVIMSHQRISYVAIAAALICGITGNVAAFQPVSVQDSSRIGRELQTNNVNDASASLLPRPITVTQSTTSLSLRKKNTPEIKKEDVRKQVWDWKLVLVYMTPWKNPNSIFVYMFALLYALGKYSESHL
jgi:hypothetical protein